MREELLIKVLEMLVGSNEPKASVATQSESAFPIGKKIIIRWRNAGVIFGTLVSVRHEAGVTVYRVKDSRRLYQWFCDSGITLEDVAIYGINASKSKICSTVPLCDITDAEISLLIPVSEESAKSIESAKSYVAS